MAGAPSSGKLHRKHSSAWRCCATRSTPQAPFISNAPQHTARCINNADGHHGVGMGLTLRRDKRLSAGLPCCSPRKHPQHHLRCMPCQQMWAPQLLLHPHWQPQHVSWLLLLHPGQQAAVQRGRSSSLWRLLHSQCLKTREPEGAADDAQTLPVTCSRHQASSDEVCSVSVCHDLSCKFGYLRVLLCCSAIVACWQAAAGTKQEPTMHVRCLAGYCLQSRMHSASCKHPVLSPAVSHWAARLNFSRYILCV